MSVLPAPGKAGRLRLRLNCLEEEPGEPDFRRQVGLRRRRFRRHSRVQLGRGPSQPVEHALQGWRPMRFPNHFIELLEDPSRRHAKMGPCLWPGAALMRSRLAPPRRAGAGIPRWPSDRRRLSHRMPVHRDLQNGLRLSEDRPSEWRGVPLDPPVELGKRQGGRGGRWGGGKQDDSPQGP